MVVSHTEKGRKICDKVKITFDPEVIGKYLSQEICKSHEWDVVRLCSFWCCDIDDILTKKSDKVNIGLIIENKYSNLEINTKEQLENEQESQFHEMVKWNKNKYRVIDRRHLSKVLEEQKLSSSGITDSETVKLGKILNLDIIVLRLIYENSRITKVLKVDTGEVLLFKTYENEKKEEGWILYGTSTDGDSYFYDKSSITQVSSKIYRVWDKVKYSKVGKDERIQTSKKYTVYSDSWEKLDYEIFLYEFDCVNNKTKLIQGLSYDDGGKVIGSGEVPNPEIRQIIPGSFQNTLQREVCPK